MAKNSKDLYWLLPIKEVSLGRNFCTFCVFVHLDLLILQSLECGEVVITFHLKNSVVMARMLICLY